MTANQDFIDQLNVEVKACFEPLKVPVEQLRQMSEGLVVEVGELINNKITLEIDGNAIANGELVVLGDKFGVLITQVPEQGEAEAQPQTLSLPAVDQGGAPAAVQPQQNPIDPQLVQALAAQGINVDELIAAAQASGEDPNAYLAQVLEDRRGAQPVQEGATPPPEGNPADAAMAEVDKMLSENAS